MTALLLLVCVLSLAGLVTVDYIFYKFNKHTQFITISCQLQPLWTDLDVQSIEQMNKNTSRPIIIDLRPSRIRRGVYGISGTLIINDDVSQYTVGNGAIFEILRPNPVLFCPITTGRRKQRSTTARKATTPSRRRRSQCNRAHFAINSTTSTENSL